MTSWWNKNAETRMDDFITWVGDAAQPTKMYCRKYVASRQYKTMLDCGCGLASEYFGFQEDKYQIDYTGLDSCTLFIEKNKEQGIKMIEAELESDFPVHDSSFELVYCREVIEHLSHYEKAISEMIRAASKEVMIIWFIEPGEEEKINYWEAEDLYHNTYDKSLVEKFILGNNKVSSISWQFIDDLTDRKDVLDELEISDESTPQLVKVRKAILHILLK